MAVGGNMKDNELDIREVGFPARIVSYDIVHINKAANHVQLKNVQIIVGEHKMIAPEATFIFNGGK